MVAVALAETEQTELFSIFPFWPTPGQGWCVLQEKMNAERITNAVMTAGFFIGVVFIHNEKVTKSTLGENPYFFSFFFFTAAFFGLVFFSKYRQ
jgi:hypothetical protein